VTVEDEARPASAVVSRRVNRLTQQLFHFAVSRQLLDVAFQHVSALYGHIPPVHALFKPLLMMFFGQLLEILEALDGLILTVGVEPSHLDLVPQNDHFEVELAEDSDVVLVPLAQRLLHVLDTLHLLRLAFGGHVLEHALHSFEALLNVFLDNLTTLVALTRAARDRDQLLVHAVEQFVLHRGRLAPRQQEVRHALLRPPVQSRLLHRDHIRGTHARVAEETQRARVQALTLPVQLLLLKFFEKFQIFVIRF